MDRHVELLCRRTANCLQQTTCGGTLLRQNESFEDERYAIHVPRAMYKYPDHNTGDIVGNSVLLYLHKIPTTDHRKKFIPTGRC